MCKHSALIQTAAVSECRCTVRRPRQGRSRPESTSPPPWIDASSTARSQRWAAVLRPCQQYPRPVTFSPSMGPLARQRSRPQEPGSRWKKARSRQILWLSPAGPQGDDVIGPQSAPAIVRGLSEGVWGGSGRTASGGVRTGTSGISFSVFNIGINYQCSNETFFEKEVNHSAKWENSFSQGNVSCIVLL